LQKKVKIFRRSEEQEDYERFRKLYQRVINSVPNSSGWYIWCRIESGEIKIIYIGQSEKLYVRLEKELKNEYVIFWMQHPKDDEPVKKLSELYKGKYNANIKRAGKKAGANIT
jgi:excinuclease UvrABC nuclease subunit